MNQLSQIREEYGVPATLRRRVRILSGGQFTGCMATITGATEDGYVRVWPETATGHRMRIRLLIPLYDLDYEPDASAPSESEEGA